MTRYPNLPLENPQPDAKRFVDILAGRAKGRPPLIELIIGYDTVRDVTTEMLDREWISPEDDLAGFWDNTIEFWYRMGYDYVRYGGGLNFEIKRVRAQDTTPGFANRDRSWADEHEGMIRTWEDFEQYPWPEPGDFDYRTHEIIGERLREGMGLMVSAGSGIFENLSWIMSLEGLAFALHDDPDLVRAVADKIGEIQLDHYRQQVEIDGVIGAFQGDDMGFKTGTLIAPDDLREYVLPWHKKFAEVFHEKGMVYYLHDCGNVEAVMPDLVHDVKIDAKHSFEDVIEPVEDFYVRWGGEIGVLGGVDVHRLASGTPDQIRRRTRELIEKCGGGRYAVGSGNSIANYIPTENYLAMVDEALA